MACDVAQIWAVALRHRGNAVFAILGVVSQRKNCLLDSTFRALTGASSVDVVSVIVGGVGTFSLSGVKRHASSLCCPVVAAASTTIVDTFLVVLMSVSLPLSLFGSPPRCPCHRDHNQGELGSWGELSQRALSRFSQNFQCVSIPIVSPISANSFPQ